MSLDHQNVDAREGPHLCLCDFSPGAVQTIPCHAEGCIGVGMNNQQLEQSQWKEDEKVVKW
ncbi:hypothetical protein DPMN_174083 [Dreissena polymorpha]|uniref:Uncharacterized protein n=1 Tax=Dreissena polymorpha TaxID=45954 RepID=A0A9D4E4R4_DREPO|nr:hypothetical protein DPMN_174083 [Dreissena polymorpha]